MSGKAQKEGHTGKVSTNYCNNYSISLDSIIYSQITCSYSPNKVGASDRDNDSLTERYRSPHNYEAPQPADYEVFQPSSVSTVASNMPLLDIDPQPYEELEGYMRQTTEDDQDNNRVYETVKNISTQENEHSNSADGHIYFTLESRDEVHVSSQL